MIGLTLNSMDEVVAEVDRAYRRRQRLRDLKSYAEEVSLHLFDMECQARMDDLNAEFRGRIADRDRRRRQEQELLHQYNQNHAAIREEQQQELRQFNQNYAAFCEKHEQELIRMSQRDGRQQQQPQASQEARARLQFEEGRERYRREQDAAMERYLVTSQPSLGSAAIVPFQQPAPAAAGALGPVVSPVDSGALPLVPLQQPALPAPVTSPVVSGALPLAPLQQPALLALPAPVTSASLSIDIEMAGERKRPAEKGKKNPSPGKKNKAIPFGGAEDSMASADERKRPPEKGNPAPSIPSEDAEDSTLLLQHDTSIWNGEKEGELKFVSVTEHPLSTSEESSDYEEESSSVAVEEHRLSASEESSDYKEESSSDDGSSNEQRSGKGIKEKQD